MSERTKDILEWIYCIVIAVVLALLIKFFLGTPTVVKQESMNPTLHPNDRLIISRLIRTTKKMPNKGDIVTFEAPKTSYIKRVIALPGDYVELKDEKVFINGEELHEEYLGSGVKTKTMGMLTSFTVPEGYVFCMGDNRDKSKDCRSFGCIPQNKIESKVKLRFWPLNKFGGVN